MSKDDVVDGVVKNFGKEEWIVFEWGVWEGNGIGLSVWSFLDSESFEKGI